MSYQAIVLHAHLPYVRHPEHPTFLEEDWLFEAITETYLPLLDIMERLRRDGARFALTMSITPPLCEMLSDALLRERYPLVREPEAARAQIGVAVANYEKHFGRKPRGIWLPECGYAPGVDRLLADFGLRFFFVDAHGLTASRPPAPRGCFVPCATPAGPVAFARDPESSKEVWSAREGYPGDPLYREFYRDLGYDAPYDYIAPYLHGDGIRRNLGIKYHRVTGNVELKDKEPYVPAWAAERTSAHAQDFLGKRRAQLGRLAAAGGGAPAVVVSPYDAELYGHWWFEGPLFLERVFRGAARAGVELVTPSQYLDRHGSALETVEPNPSTWGNGGYNATWLNDDTAWMYFHQHACERQMVELAAGKPRAAGVERRALNQAARELLLAQSSDWAFIITNGTVTPYAVKRFRTHVHRFNRIARQLRTGQVDTAMLAEFESADNIFPEMDYRTFAPGS